MAWGPQGSEGATYVPEPKVVHKGQQLEIQQNKNQRCQIMHLLKIKILQTDAQESGLWNTLQ